MLFKKKQPPQPLRGLRHRPDQPAGPNRGQVFSYHAARSQRQDGMGRVNPGKAERLEAFRKRFAWLRHTPNAVLACVAGALLLYALHLNSQAKVVPIEDSSNQVFLRPQETYQEAAQRAFSSSILNGNKLTVNTAQITKDLKKQFPELRTIAISLPLLSGQPAVYIQPSTPALILSTKDSGVFVLDTTGKALITGNQVANLARLKLPVVTDESGIQIQAGVVALPSDQVAFITEVIGQLKAKNISVTSLSLPPAASELQIKVDGAGYYVRFNLHGNAREEAGRFIAAKGDLDAKHRTPGQYVDVRAENRVYYR